MKLKLFMAKPTAYDVFISMLKNFPEGKTTFRADYCDIIDFLSKRREQYPLLSRFTRDEIEGGLGILIGAGMLQWNTVSPHIKDFKPSQINHAFAYYHKSELFGEKDLEEIAKLSREFIKKFA